MYIYFFFKGKKKLCEGKIHNLLEHSGTLFFAMEYSNLFIYLFYLLIYLFAEACVEPTWWNNKGQENWAQLGEPGRARPNAKTQGYNYGYSH